MLQEDAPVALAIPDNLRDFFRSQVGVVISTPDHSYRIKGVEFDPPLIGEMVIAHPADGVHINGADMGAYCPCGQVRVFGAFAEYVGQPEPVEWWQSILASIQPDMSYRAYGDRIIFRKDKASGMTAYGIFLPDGHHERSEMAVVVSRGPLVSPDVREGNRVSYNPHYVEQNGVDLGTGLADFDFFIAGELAINYVVAQE